MRWLGEVEGAFSGSGIKSFVLEGALKELEVTLPPEEGEGMGVWMTRSVIAGMSIQQASRCADF